MRQIVVAFLMVMMLLASCGASAGNVGTTTGAVKDVATISHQQESVDTTHPYDGLWMGETSNGDSFGFRVESDQITWAQLELEPGECPGSHLDSIQKYDPPLGRVHEGDFSAAAEGFAEIEGTFVTNATARGTALGCVGGLTLQWEAERVGDAAMTIPVDDWYGWPPPTDALPEQDVANGLCDRDAGPARFDENDPYFATNDDWYLVGTWARTFIAVPAGWSTAESGSGTTVIAFSEERDLEIDLMAGVIKGEPEGYVMLGIDEGFAANDINGVLQKLTVGMEESGPETEIIDAAVVGDSQAYAIAELPWRGDTRRVLIVASWNPLEEWYQVFKSIFDTVAEWDDYYPIVRSMLGSWRALDGTALGPLLPIEVS